MLSNSSVCKKGELAVICASEGTGHSYMGLLHRAKAALATSVEVSVAADDLRPYPDQPRRHFDEVALRRLSESIDAGGQTTAGIIREKPGTTRYELIDGERRWRAINFIPADRRPQYKARLIKADDAVVQYLISGIANFNREGHTPLETSDTIRRLIKFELPMPEIAALLGISEQWASQMYGLRKLAPEVRAMLDPTLTRREQLPITAAIEISKIDPSLQKGLADRVMCRDVTLIGLRGEVVRVAKAAGKDVPTRSELPRRQWQRILEQEPQIGRGAKNMLNRLDAEFVPEYIKAHPVVQHEARKLIQRLAALRASIELVEAKLTAAVGTK